MNEHSLRGRTSQTQQAGVPLSRTISHGNLRWIAFVLSVIAPLLFVCSVLFSSEEPPPIKPDPSASRDRGKYLVHQVAMCVMCHSPRNPNGELEPTRLLSGAPIPVGNPFPSQAWAGQAPRLAGLPGWEESGVMELLTEGRTRDGFSPRPPMPPFRFNREDAAAIVSYLKSLH